MVRRITISVSLLKGRSVQGDVATKAGVTKVAEQISAKESVVCPSLCLEVSLLTPDKVDVLINCAGVSRAWKNPITDHNDRTPMLPASGDGMTRGSADSVEKLLWEGVDEYVAPLQFRDIAHTSQ